MSLHRAVFAIFILSSILKIETHAQGETCDPVAFSNCLGEEVVAHPVLVSYVQAISKTEIPEMDNNTLLEMCNATTHIKYCVGTSLSGCAPKYRLTFDLITSSSDFFCTNKLEYLQHSSCITMQNTSEIMESCLADTMLNITNTISNTENVKIDSPETCGILEDAKTCVWDSLTNLCDLTAVEFVDSYLNTLTLPFEMFFGCYNVIMPSSSTTDASVVVSESTTPVVPSDVTVPHAEVTQNNVTHEPTPEPESEPEPGSEPEVTPEESEPEPGSEPEVTPEVNQADISTSEPEVVSTQGHEWNESTPEPVPEMSDNYSSSTTTTSSPIVQSTQAMYVTEKVNTSSSDQDYDSCGVAKMGKCLKSSIDRTEYLEHITSLSSFLEMPNITSEDVEIMCRSFMEFKSCVADYYKNCSGKMQLSYETIVASIDFTCGEGFNAYLESRMCLEGSDVKNKTTMCVKNMVNNLTYAVQSDDQTENTMIQGCRNVQMAAYCAVNATFDSCGHDAAAAVANALQAVLAPIRDYFSCDSTPYNELFTAPATSTSSPTTMKSSTSETSTPESTTTTSETTTKSSEATSEPISVPEVISTTTESATTTQHTTEEPTTTTFSTTTTTEPTTTQKSENPSTSSQTTTFPTTTTTAYPEMDRDCNKCHYNGPGYFPETLKRRFNYWCHVNCPFYCPDSICKCGCDKPKPRRLSCNPTPAYKYTPGMRDWCNNNCVIKENCPIHICACEWPIASVDEPLPPVNTGFDESNDEDDFDFNNIFN